MSVLAKFLYDIEIDYLLYLDLVLIGSIIIRDMFNLKDFINGNRQKVTVINDDVDFEEVSKFYHMLVKYKNSHPFFNIEYVILKVYPNLNWKQFISEMKL